MLAALTLALTLVSSPRLEVAYIARYYYPPPSKKTSRYHVYLTDLQGKRRVQASRANSKVTEFVGWIDRNRVAWGTSDGKWETYNSNTGQHGFLKRKPKELDVSTRPSRADDTNKVSLPDEPAITIDSSNPEGIVLSRSRVKVKLKSLEEEPYYYLLLYPTGRPTSTYLISVDGSANGMYEEWRLYTIDWSAASCSLSRRYVKEVKLYVDRDLALCEQMDRNLIPYGDLSVWGSELYAFNLSKKKIWKVVTGLVNAHSPRLRP